MNLWDRAKQGAEPGRTENPKPGERRAKDRKRQRMIDGFVSSGRAPTPQPCTVCDMSSGGSKVQLWNDKARLRPGDRVTLYIPGDRQEVDAEVAWRKENFMGVRFTSPFRAPSRQYS